MFMYYDGDIHTGEEGGIATKKRKGKHQIARQVETKGSTSSKPKTSRTADWSHGRSSEGESARQNRESVFSRELYRI
jgi:hypothetical protein